MSLRASRGGAPTVTPPPPLLDTLVGAHVLAREFRQKPMMGAGNGPTGRSSREPQNPLRTRTSARTKDSTVGAVEAGREKQIPTYERDRQD